MGEKMKCAPPLSKETGVLDVKPLRTLSPMFPASLGLNAVSPPASWPFVFVTPHGSFTSGNEVLFPSNFCSLYPSFCPNGMDKKSIKSSQVKKTNGSVHDGAGKNGNGPSHDTVLAPCPLRAMPVITVLSDNDEDLLLNDGLSTSDVKIEQPVPLGSCPVGGGEIEGSDMKKPKRKRFKKAQDPELMMLPSSSYDARESVEAILMTFDALRRRLLQLEEVKDVNKRSVTKAGTIMMDHDLRANNVKRIGHVPGIEKLERGNLALERSLHRGNEIRVIRTAKDVSSPGSKIYIYDGLYKINKSWVEKAKSGFNVFKYKLVREPGQPDGIVTWKMIERWRKDPSLRGKVILPDMSSGDEKLPVCLVNDVDDEKGPSHFTYTTKLHVSSSISKTLHGCMCHNVCLPGDANCSCVLLNGGDLPYTSNGLLVSHKPLIYECGTSCQCTPSCRNRLTQNGITHRFEVFRTKDRGWGLRSWDPIRAGAFICEYTGEVIDKGREDEDGENEYTFQPTNTDDNAFSWNYIPELLGEPSHPDSSDTIKPLQIIISAKNMGNISRFMNHSCSPNVFWQAVQRDNGDEGYPHIVFFAIRHIPPMTELTYDYGPCGDEIVKEEAPNSDRSRRPKKCLCKSPKCRGVFR
ncbi:hypothetical protein J5N97_014494 [Dioscorea zingiberensis]|uniref:Uncharacterized protein n=1 Tax=Dioscorea zingiberensis TaxID=325984 RepID=A0A9D5HJJ5_9LILI|nr:hypothetical protein J5N97_014494 [Dioscorea zingiberensis]